jgi:hypothetical protein
MLVSFKDSLLQWTNIVTQESEPVTIHANLAHVNVTRGYVFVAAFQTWILSSTGITRSQLNNHRGKYMQINGFRKWKNSPFRPRMIFYHALYV